ncbi:CLUMA_CG007318, isoform A [Clunio marinus]|uniref:Alpha-1,3-glucosyltransferase n=1 Tax=Clunio marinus TaxID=568069 RepID=A0A1J1I4I7_9DIPT|nr:CLUMA_CG007318, isoform A [Clunio marinus]
MSRNVSNKEFVTEMFSNRSTDFEVHRNWLAITKSTNISEWYYEETSQWTLDYPPLFAYFEYVLSFVAEYFDPEMLKIENLNYASANTILFQRLSVIFVDVVYFLGVRECFKNLNQIGKNYHAILLLFNVGLIIVDHIHFQYNGMLFGILLLSCGKMFQRKFLQSAFYFAVLLNMKHIFIYMAPVYFCYLIRHYCFGSISKFIQNVVKLGCVVIAVTSISFGPFIKHLPQVISRLFPFKRGLTHAYWAPNFWALYNVVDKVLTVVKRIPQNDSTTGGLVQEFKHNVLPSITPAITFLAVAVMMIPCCLKLLTNKTESPKSFMKPLIICAATSFMFGWHVHEKAVLMILIPLQVLTFHDKSESGSSLFVSIFGLYSLTPLLYTSELIIPKGKNISYVKIT